MIRGLLRPLALQHLLHGNKEVTCLSHVVVSSRKYMVDSKFPLMFDFEQRSSYYNKGSSYLICNL